MQLGLHELMSEHGPHLLQPQDDLFSFGDGSVGEDNEMR